MFAGLVETVFKVELFLMLKIHRHHQYLVESSCNVVIECCTIS